MTSDGGVAVLAAGALGLLLGRVLAAGALHRARFRRLDRQRRRARRMAWQHDYIPHVPSDLDGVRVVKRLAMTRADFCRIADAVEAETRARLLDPGWESWGTELSPPERLAGER